MTNPFYKLQAEEDDRLTIWLDLLALPSCVAQLPGTVTLPCCPSILPSLFVAASFGATPGGNVLAS